jgi:hypothetical protein
VENNRCLEGMKSLSEEIITVTTDGEILVCLSDKINELVSYISEKEEYVVKIEAKKSHLSKVSDEIPASFFLDLIIRTTDWFSGCIKIHINHFFHLKIQKNILQYKTLSDQIINSDIFIPPLKYYIYTLEKIIT